jgi:hypothetical protein
LSAASARCGKVPSLAPLLIQCRGIFTGAQGRRRTVAAPFAPGKGVSIHGAVSSKVCHAS